MSDIDVNADERTVILAALVEAYQRYSEPYKRKQYQKATDVPKPSAEMCKFLKTVDRLIIKLRTNGWVES